VVTTGCVVLCCVHCYVDDGAVLIFFFSIRFTDT
jgi:hypothetical protein